MRPAESGPLFFFFLITLERTAKRSRAKYEENAVTETNLALEVFLDQRFYISVSLDSDADLTPDTVVDAWRSAIKNREHWSVEQGLEDLIDSFSFKKIALLRQPERSTDRVEGQSTLRALCGDAQLDPPYRQRRQAPQADAGEGRSVVGPDGPRKSVLPKGVLQGAATVRTTLRRKNCPILPPNMAGQGVTRRHRPVAATPSLPTMRDSQARGQTV